MSDMYYICEFGGDAVLRLLPSMPIVPPKQSLNT